MSAGTPSVAAYLRVLRRELPQLDLGRDVPSRTRDMISMAAGLLDHLAVRIEEVSPPPAGPTFGEDADWVARRAQVIAAREALDASAAAELAESVANSPTAEAHTADAGAIEAYLRARLAEPGLVVTSLSAPLGGYSKDTFIARLAGSAHTGVVLRCDAPSGPVESTVADEMNVLRLMRAEGVPVAEPLWIEPDPALLGHPFLVTALVPGETAMNFRQDVASGVGADIAGAFAEVLGAIHATCTHGLASESAHAEEPLEHHVRRLLDQYEAQWQRRGGSANPIVDTAFAWMRANIPSPSGSASIVHGDPTMRNLMIADGRVTALLDWETWHLGDAAEDLAYCKDEIERFLPWERFMALYAARRGQGVDPAAIRYWGLWKFLRGTVTSVSMTHNVLTDPHADLRTAFGGVHYTRWCMQELAKKLESVIAEEG